MTSGTMLEVNRLRSLQFRGERERASSETAARTAEVERLADIKRKASSL
jgi:hypothetical protein